MQAVMRIGIRRQRRGLAVPIQCNLQECGDVVGEAICLTNLGHVYAATLAWPVHR
jgi:hypothetical protein